jgi:hypothetical protein
MQFLLTVAIESQWDPAEYNKSDPDRDMNI